MHDGGDGKGLSAAAARRVVRRFKTPPQIAAPATYEVTDGTTTHTGKFNTVAALCPNVKTSTLKRRLESGERDLTKLRRPPEPKQGARKRRMKR